MKTSQSLDRKEIFQGVKLAFRGAAMTLKCQKTKTQLFKLAAIVALVMTAMILTTRLIYAPINFLLSLFISEFERERLSNSLDLSIYLGMSFLVDFSLLIVKYSFPNLLDRIFFQTLKSTGQILYQKELFQFIDKLENAGPRETRWVALTSYIVRTLKKSGKLVSIWLLSKLPVIGVLVIPTATITLVYQMFGPIFACLSITVYIMRYWWGIPGKNFIVSNLFSLRSFSREVLDPYLSRSRMDHKQKKAWFKKNNWFIVGFSLPFFVCSRIPIAGPFVFALAVSSSVSLCFEICHESDQ